MRNESKINKDKHSLFCIIAYSVQSASQYFLAIVINTLSCTKTLFSKQNLPFIHIEKSCRICVFFYFWRAAQLMSCQQSIIFGQQTTTLIDCVAVFKWLLNTKWIVTGSLLLIFHGFQFSMGNIFSRQRQETTRNFVLNWILMNVYFELAVSRRVYTNSLRYLLFIDATEKQKELLQS